MSGRYAWLVVLAAGLAAATAAAAGCKRAGPDEATVTRVRDAERRFDELWKRWNDRWTAALGAGPGEMDRIDRDATREILALVQPDDTLRAAALCILDRAAVEKPMEGTSGLEGLNWIGITPWAWMLDALRELRGESVKGHKGKPCAMPGPGPDPDVRENVHNIGRAVDAYLMETAQVPAASPCTGTPPRNEFSVPRDPSAVAGKWYTPAEADWATGPWAELGFELVGPIRAVYCVEGGADGFAVHASTDLDADGTWSHYRWAQGPDGVGQGMTVESPAE
ncbi:MAG: hypothetical protein HY907_01780 [Deltaproteobacteria bacterium]|nr:hypothetical protein [Deltaproteobacteria bacterium]